MKVYGTVKTKDAAKIVLFAGENNILYHDAELKHGVTAEEAVEAFYIGACVAGEEINGMYLVSKCVPADDEVPFAVLGTMGAGEFNTIEKPVT